MPIYEYQCKACETCFEKLVFAGDDEAPVCPCCNGQDVQKMMSAASVFGRPGIGACAAGSPSGFS